MEIEAMLGRVFSRLQDRGLGVRGIKDMDAELGIPALGAVYLFQRTGYQPQKCAGTDQASIGILGTAGAGGAGGPDHYRAGLPLRTAENLAV